MIVSERITLRKGDSVIRVVPESVGAFEAAGFEREPVKPAAKTRSRSAAKKEDD